MDPAGIGALIGIAIMVVGVGTYLLYEKCQRGKVQSVEIPASVKNPLLKKKQSSMKKLFVQNG